MEDCSLLEQGEQEEEYMALLSQCMQHRQNERQQRLQEEMQLLEQEIRNHEARARERRARAAEREHQRRLWAAREEDRELDAQQHDLECELQWATIRQASQRVEPSPPLALSPSKLAAELSIQLQLEKEERRIRVQHEKLLMHALLSPRSQARSRQCTPQSSSLTAVADLNPLSGRLPPLLEGGLSQGSWVQHPSYPVREWDDGLSRRSQTPDSRLHVVGHIRRRVRTEEYARHVAGAGLQGLPSTLKAQAHYRAKPPGLSHTKGPLASPSRTSNQRSALGSTRGSKPQRLYLEYLAPYSLYPSRRQSLAVPAHR
mmetsp:Transcript_114984/g.200036  ORF Transcript_114984/g.200036 Transcript_114984/m.200036 type:complete len:315 (+) Transcript_114984:232-1176(+)